MEVNQDPGLQPKKNKPQSQQPINSQEFTNAFQKAAQNAGPQAVQAMEESEKSRMKQKKTKKAEEALISEEEEEESVHKTFQNLKQKLKALVHLERQGIKFKKPPKE
jgi:hypothetical protein